MENDKELLDRLVCACDVGHDCPRRKVVAQALQAAYRAGQEAMRERAAALLSEWDCDCEFDDDRERCASCSVDIRALPIEDKP